MCLVALNTLILGIVKVSVTTSAIIWAKKTNNKRSMIGQTDSSRDKPANSCGVSAAFRESAGIDETIDCDAFCESKAKQLLKIRWRQRELTCRRFSDWSSSNSWSRAYWWTKRRAFSWWKSTSVSHNRLVDRSNTRRHCNHRSSSIWNDDDDDEKIEASSFLWDVYLHTFCVWVSSASWNLEKEFLYSIPADIRRALTWHGSTKQLTIFKQREPGNVGLA